MCPSPVPLAEVTRGPVVESVHLGHAAAVTGDGRLAFALGDADHVVFLRSSAKPVQALPALVGGAAERFGFTDREVALACGSHEGEQIHRETALQMLAKAGLGPEALRCGVKAPLSEAEADDLVRRGEPPSLPHNECSGEHAAMLALAVHLGAPTESYTRPEHPVQRRILESVARFTGVDAGAIARGMDGCGIPTFAVPLRAAALLAVRVVAPPATWDAPTRTACARIVRAMTEHPEMVDGTRPDRLLDSALMLAGGGRLVSKMGAEGLVVVGVRPSERWPTGLGVAVKVSDGDPDERARSPVTVAPPPRRALGRRSRRPSVAPDCSGYGQRRRHGRGRAGGTRPVDSRHRVTGSSSGGLHRAALRRHPIPHEHTPKELSATPCSPGEPLRPRRIPDPMDHQIPLDPAGRADDPADDAARGDGTHEIAADLAYKRLAIVNVVFYGRPGAGDRGWVLVDTGIAGSAGAIASAAAERFGDGARPAAIVMTHGHFDHVGALEALAEQWDAPVVAHALERPYLDGAAAYPPPDPSVGGGLMARLSPLYPSAPVDVGARLQTLPADGTVPHMPGWRWVHTPGHTPGHVSLWREADRALVVGDAFVTTAQESAYAALTQAPAMHGPPMYFTPDWPSAKASVSALAALEPEVVVTGHGRAMEGAGMREALHALARDFDRVAVPEHGRYVGAPARAEDGSAYRDPDA